MLAIAAMIVVSLVPLARSQASHYAFPAAGLFGLAWARATSLGAVPRSGRIPVALATLVILAGASVVAFARPDVARRFAGVSSFAVDERIRADLTARDPNGSGLLALARSGYLLHVSGRSPVPVVLINTSAQTARKLSDDPGQVLRALDDPGVSIVAWDPESWKPDHPSMRGVIDDTRLATLNSRLQREFERFEPEQGIVMWQRRR
jgi:hypothetical protein